MLRVWAVVGIFLFLSSLDAESRQKPTYKILKVNGQPTFLSKYNVKNNKPGIMSFSTNNLSQIRVDKNHDGITDILIVQNDSTKITAFNPVKGKFLNLEAEVREKSGIRHMTFILGYNRKSYSLMNTYFTPYQKYADSIDFNTMQELNGSCMMKERNSNLANALSFIRLTVPLLRSRLGDSCYGNDDFPDQVLEKAQSDVITSYDSSNKYLGCLRNFKSVAADLGVKIDFDLGFLADSIVMKYYSDSKDQFGEYDLMIAKTKLFEQYSTLDPKASSQDIKSNSKPSMFKGVDFFAKDSANAQTFKPLTKAGLADNRKFKPWIQCAQRTGEVKDWLGSYDNQLRQITIYPDALLNHINSTRDLTTVQNSYSDLIFHESLHSAGVLDEKEVRQLETVCGRSDTDENRKKALAELKTYFQDNKGRNMQLDSQIATAMSTIPGFQDVFLKQVEKLGFTVAKQLFNNLLSSMQGANDFRKTFEGTELSVTTFENGLKVAIETTCKPGPMQATCTESLTAMAGAIRSEMISTSCNATESAGVIHNNLMNAAIGLLIDKAEAQTTSYKTYENSCLIKMFPDFAPPISDIFSSVNGTTPPFDSQFRYSTRVSESKTSRDIDPTKGQSMDNTDVPVTSPTRSIGYSLDDLSSVRNYVNQETQNSDFFFGSISKAANYIAKNVLPTANAESNTSSVLSTRFPASVSDRNSGSAVTENPQDDSPTNRRSSSGRAGRWKSSGFDDSSDLTEQGRGSNAGGSSKDGSGHLDKEAATEKNARGDKKVMNSDAKKDSENKDQRTRGGSDRKAANSGESTNLKSKDLQAQNEDRPHFTSIEDLRKYLAKTPVQKVERSLRSNVPSSELDTLRARIVVRDGTAYGSSVNSTMYLFKYDNAKKKFIEKSQR